MTTYLESIQEGLLRAFEADDKVLLLGEDLLDPYGGAFKVSRGLSTRFPDRVLTTPISEAGFTGVATGLAARGYRPVVEIMFGDFITLTVDQIVNHAGKFFDLYRGNVQVPLLIRTPMGGGRGYGATHSQCLEKILLGVPGLRVVAPSHFHQPGELLKKAILEVDQPMLFLEHKLLYPQKLVDSIRGFRIETVEETGGFPTSIISNFTSGVADVTVITYGGTSIPLLKLMKEMQSEEINIVAALPSSLDPVPIGSLGKAARQSGRVLIVEEGTEDFNWGSEVASQLYEHHWSALSQPIRRLASKRTAIPCAEELESEVLVTASKIEESVMASLV